MNEKKETAEEFVNRMLTTVTPKKLPQYPNLTFYVDANNCIFFALNSYKSENDSALCCRPDFIDVLAYKYKCKYVDIKHIIINVLKEKFDLDIKYVPVDILNMLIDIENKEIDHAVNV